MSINDINEPPTIYNNPFTDEQFRDIILMEEDAVINLAKLIYVDTSNYHCIYINNIRSHSVMIYNDMKWKVGNINEILSYVLCITIKLLMDYIDENRVLLNKMCVSNILNFVSNLPQNNIKLKNELKLILINGRKLIRESYDKSIS